MKTNSRRASSLLAGLTLSCGLTCAADSGLGDLPGGAISTSDMSIVGAEICRDHLFDPRAAPSKLPSGYRLISAAEAAIANRPLAAVLLANPKYGSYALGSLCFLSIGSFVVDGTPVQSVGPMPAAFWWATAAGPRHADMRGKMEWVQLGSWYPSGTQHRSAILKTDPMAQFVPIDLKQSEPNTWRMRLVLAGETVEAEVRSSGQRRKRPVAAEPSYMSVPMSGESADYFSVYTYFGHLHQSAEGAWRATGTGVFSDALAIPNESAVFETIFQEGWTARSGLYRFAPRQ